ncbi:hypothetical protein [Diaphorobacter aerolatus]|uniref:TolC family protein n=1 Tax=Diaphorobacter aerolatus TaxID=1288495 RepID=A0A7H0GHX7_9BURK|nr:hypothetical protein [Diaphorobacter aerolatus]QNP47893.1 hypothetical protein H9K75_17435 [Diaphorobacter aerolatus]
MKKISRRCRKIVMSAPMALIFLTTTAQGHASEIDTFCQLSEAQSKATSALLASPDVFTSIGDPVTAERSMTVGVRHSWMRHQRAKLTTQLALAECNAYRSERQLLEQVGQAEARAELLSIIRAEDKWQHALTSAQTNLRWEQELLMAQQSRLTDVKAAFDQVEMVRREIATARVRKVHAQSLLPEAEEPIQVLLERAVNARAQVVDLGARLNRPNAWDVSYAAGMRTNLNSSNRQGFVAVTASWNIGQAESERASARVVELTTQWLREKHGDQTQTFLRAKEAVLGRISAGELLLESYQARQELLTSAQLRLASVSTTDGERMKRSMAVEQYILHAQIASAQSQLDYLKAWMTRNGQ